MLNRLLSLVQRLATGRIVLILFLVTAAFGLTLNVTNIPIGVKVFQERAGGRDIMDMRSSYTSDEVYAVLEALGPEGRELYATMHLAVDFVFPLFYSFFFATLFAWILGRLAPAGHPVQQLSLLAFVSLLADWSENICVLILNWSFPQRLEGLARVASVFTTIKFSMAPLSFGVLLVALLFFGWRARRRDRRLPREVA